jgi:hypothetical protein
MSDTQIAPTEGRGGAVPSGEEFAAKGDAAVMAREGIVPAGLGGSDAPEELLSEDPELKSGVSGGFASDPDVTATDGGVDISGGDNADATSIGGPENVDDAPEPDLKDAPVAQQVGADDGAADS